MLSREGFGGTGSRRSALAAVLGLSLCLTQASNAAPDAPLRLAQTSPQPSSTPDPEAAAARDKELEAARAEQQKAAEAEAQLRREIESIGNSRRDLNQQLIDTAARIQGAEARLSAIEGRLQALDENEQRIRKSLSSRQGAIAEVLAALQRIGRRPPPALLVRPEDALQSVRSAMLLGAVVPELRGEAEALTGDLADLARVRKDIIGEREQLRREVVAFSDQGRRMSLLVEERQKRQTEVESALAAEQQRTAQLSRQVDNLKDLIAKLDQGRTVPATPSPAEDTVPVDARARLAALKDPARLAPAISFSAAKGLLPLPVNGIRIKDYGGPDGSGGILRGISIATRVGAQVTSPCDGTVIHAGLFRTYGQLLILDAGGGYRVLLAGMERISVSLGQFVVTGEPVALMGGGSQAATALTTGSRQPVLYVEFRKDGTPIDPSPWWASEGEKVRG